jgi:hypothetical protein
VAGERIAHDQLLNGERMGDVTPRERTDDRLGDAEIGKRNGYGSAPYLNAREILRPLGAQWHAEETEPLGWRFGQTRPIHRSRRFRVKGQSGPINRKRPAGGGGALLGLLQGGEICISIYVWIRGR